MAMENCTSQPACVCEGACVRICVCVCLSVRERVYVFGPCDVSMHIQCRGVCQAGGVIYADAAQHSRRAI